MKNKFWVYATSTRNYMLKDPVVDWIQLYRPRERRIDRFKTFILKKGVEFEKNIIADLRKKYRVKSVHPNFNMRYVEQTMNYMHQGIPFIHSASLWNPVDKTFGVIDLLVRHDFLNKLSTLRPIEIENKKASKLHGDYHYIAVEIKNSTLQLRKKNNGILNQKSIPAYKAQLCIYNNALSHMQGYFPPSSYILGRRIITQIDRLFPFEALGEVDWKGADQKYLEQTREAVEWSRKVNEEGRFWNLFHPYLSPNMKIDSGEWNQAKQKLAWERGEITSEGKYEAKQRLDAKCVNCKHNCTWKDPQFRTSIFKMKDHRTSALDPMLLDNNRLPSNAIVKCFPKNVQHEKTEEEIFVNPQNTNSDQTFPYPDKEE